jgi:hypothetical protein
MSVIFHIRSQSSDCIMQVALELARRVAWNIRYDLVPLFGPSFPDSCLVRSSPPAYPPAHRASSHPPTSQNSPLEKERTRPVDAPCPDHPTALFPRQPDQPDNVRTNRPRPRAVRVSAGQQRVDPGRARVRRVRAGRRGVCGPARTARSRVLVPVPGALSQPGPRLALVCVLDDQARVHPGAGKTIRPMRRCSTPSRCTLPRSSSNSSKRVGMGSTMRNSLLRSIITRPSFNSRRGSNNKSRNTPHPEWASHYHTSTATPPQHTNHTPQTRTCSSSTRMPNTRTYTGQY